MCRQCTSGHHDNCLGIVYNHIMREFRKCGCSHYWTEPDKGPGVAVRY